jgi:hypothetical protein
MSRIILLFAVFLLLFGCISQPIRPAQPDVRGQIAQDTASTASALSKTQSQAYWQSATPFSILAWKYTSNTVELSIVNRDSSEITLSDITLDGETLISSSVTFSPDQTLAVTGMLSSACGNSGDGFSIDNVLITYEKEGAAGLSQKGGKPIVGTCS